MTPDDLIDCYGADTARWPAGDRDAALQAIAADPALRVRLAEAASLDAVLGDWATRSIAAPDSAALAARILVPAPRWPRIAGVGGLIAASVAAVMFVAPMTRVVVAPTATTAAATDATDAAEFASLFTPTPDEETAI